MSRKKTVRVVWTKWNFFLEWSDSLFNFIARRQSNDDPRCWSVFSKSLKKTAFVTVFLCIIFEVGGFVELLKPPLKPLSPYPAQ
jgi:hypothetical protein